MNDFSIAQQPSRETLVRALLAARYGQDMVTDELVAVTLAAADATGGSAE